MCNAATSILSFLPQHTESALENKGKDAEKKRPCKRRVRFCANHKSSSQDLPLLQHYLGMLLGKFPISQQHAPVDKKANSVPGCLQKSVTNRLREVLLPLSAPGVLCPVLGSPVKRNK